MKSLFFLVSVLACMVTPDLHVEDPYKQGVINQKQNNITSSLFALNDTFQNVSLELTENNSIPLVETKKKERRLQAINVTLPNTTLPAAKINDKIKKKIIAYTLAGGAALCFLCVLGCVACRLLEKAVIAIVCCPCKTLWKCSKLCCKCFCKGCKKCFYSTSTSRSSHTSRIQQIQL